MNFDFGLACTLPGKRQTVGRGELYVIVVAVFNTDHSCPLMVVADSLATKNRFDSLAAGGWEVDMEIAKADLWQVLARLLRNRPSSFALV